MEWEAKALAKGEMGLLGAVEAMLGGCAVGCRFYMCNGMSQRVVGRGNRGRGGFFVPTKGYRRKCQAAGTRSGKGLRYATE